MEVYNILHISKYQYVGLSENRIPLTSSHLSQFSLFEGQLSGRFLYRISRIPIEEMSLSKIVVSQNLLTLLTYWFVMMFPFKLLGWIHYFQRNPNIISFVGYIISIYPRRSPLNHGLIQKKTVSQWFSHHFHTQTAASPECHTLRVTRQGMASRLQHCVEDLHRGI